jgi:hypothetical protein
MTSDFHLRADDLPDARGERVKVMAKGFETALAHAQSDPETRLRMILGEAYAKITETVEWLRLEILGEPIPVRDMADRFCRDPELLLRRGDGDVGATQLKLLLLALRKDG